MKCLLHMSGFILDITIKWTVVQNQHQGRIDTEPGRLNVAQYTTGAQYFDFYVLHVMHGDIFAWVLNWD